MNFRMMKAIFVGLIVVLASACTRQVTNNVTYKDSSPPPENNSSGGVINGGGGKGVLCKKNGKTTVELLDLYEARIIYKLKPISFGEDEATAKSNLSLALAKHFYHPGHVELEKLAKEYQKIFVDEVSKQIQYIEKGTKLKYVPDALEPTLTEGCEYVQIAHYYDESVLLVDRNLSDQMDWTNRVALLAHEILYFRARQEGVNNSMSTRKLVGHMFSTTPNRPLTEGVPLDQDKFVDCDIDGKKGLFYMYPNSDERGVPTVEAVFEYFGKSAHLFRTSAVLEDLRLSSLKNVSEGMNRTSELFVDTYPTQNWIKFNFTENKNDRLEGTLELSQVAQGGATSTYPFSCRWPRDLSKLTGVTVKNVGRHQHKDHADEILEIFSDGSFTHDVTYADLTATASCHVLIGGTIEEEKNSEVSYVRNSVELADNSNNPQYNEEKCDDYVKAESKRSVDGGFRSAFDLKKYKKLK